MVANRFDFAAWCSFNRGTKRGCVYVLTVAATLALVISGCAGELDNPAVGTKGQAVETLVPLVTDNATWKYWDQGSNLGLAWRELNYNDSTWASGPAQLGYGDGDEATVVSYGGDSSNRHLTYYYRHTFQVVDASAFTWLDIELLRDDGAAVYINGFEVMRDNLPAGHLDYRTRASSALTSATESDWIAASVQTAGLLVDGTNVVAVEVHQRSETSSDTSFNLRLTGSDRTIGAGEEIAVYEPFDVFVANSASWHYLDDGSNQGSAWRAPSFDDSAWATGDAELGYGDGDEATVVSYGPDSNNRYRTTYFRKQFQVTGASGYGSIDIDMVRDDGALVYLNGAEVWRDNMPGGPIDYLTKASSALSSSTESDWISTTVSAAGWLQEGTNTVAVEVHQRTDGSSDLSFNLYIAGRASEPPADPDDSDPDDPDPDDPDDPDPDDPDPDDPDPDDPDPDDPDPDDPDPDPPPPAANGQYILAGSDWRYLDDGSDQGTAWTAIGFADSTWLAGPAQLGYGDGDEATVVDYGPSSSAKHLTYYFRNTFQVVDPAEFPWLQMGLVRDDGAAVYINGVEVWRDNMPSGPIDYTTRASSALSSSVESDWMQKTIASSGVLVAGINVVAVEVHQRSSGSSDMSFDFSLTGSNQAGSVIRGPYLQIATEDSIVIRWRTDIPTDSRVDYGSASTALTEMAFSATPTTEHEVTLTGLSPDTTYYYAVGHTPGVLAGGDDDHRFKTAPVTGSSTPVRIWVLGDSGTANDNAADVRDAFYTWNNGDAPDVWLMLGDNAYDDGTDSEYQRAVFDMYPATLRRSALFSTFGNHDAVSADSSTGTGTYYDIFTLPRSAEAGGVSSGTEAYYSFNFGNVHLVCLDSQESDRSPGGAMLTWLATDLAVNDADWLIAFWHHPPYSKGSHNSDTESKLVDMRENALPILEAYGVDLVLSGHSHSYERSMLIDNHYGASSSLTSANILDGGDGQLGGDGAYEKPTLGPGANEGAVYITAGSSGKTSSGPLDHPAMLVSLKELGSLGIEVSGDQMHVHFIDNVSGVPDHFTISKAAPQSANAGVEAGQ